jgi:hypothetical protein
MVKPKLIHKIFFWIVLGFLSTFFAEVFAGSAPDFLFMSFGYYGIVPIYLLHTLLLAALVIGRRKWFSLRTLYFASLLFGMYEAYITKVLWNPPWNPNAISLAHMAVAETILLVFFWHSIFSFMLPLFWIESLTTPAPQLPGLLPEKWHKRLIGYRGAILIGLVGSILAGSAVGNPEQALMYVLVDCLTLSALVFLAKLFNRKKAFDLASFLPRRGEAVVLGILLLVVYLLFGINLRRDIHPGFLGHAAILFMYGAIILLIILSMRKDRQQAAVMEEKQTQTRGFSTKHWFTLCGILILSAPLVSLIPENLRGLLTGFVLLSCVALGLVFMVSSLINLFRKAKIQQLE